MQKTNPKTETKTERKPYASPKLTSHGDVRSLTQGIGNGGCSQLQIPK